MPKKCLFTLVTFIASTLSTATLAESLSQDTAMTHLIALSDPERGIGVRLSGTTAEQEAANYIKQQLEGMGLSYQSQTFPVPPKFAKWLLTEPDNSEVKGVKESENIIVSIPGKSEKTIVIGAHYDSASPNPGIHGAADNASGVSLLLSLIPELQAKALPYTVKLIFFGMEEQGKIGAFDYVRKNLKSAPALEDIVGMINLDTVIGGDYLYVSSASQKPYPCPSLGNQDYSASPEFRHAVVSASLKAGAEYLVHPKNQQFEEGETGSWSDHAPFACVGLPVAYIEATNFDINGRSGKDGYSQTVHPDAWTCFDPTSIGACDRETEKRWGEIWHTDLDKLSTLEAMFPGRIAKQLETHKKVLIEFLTNPESHLGTSK